MPWFEIARRRQTRMCSIAAEGNDEALDKHPIGRQPHRTRRKLPWYDLRPGQLVDLNLPQFRESSPGLVIIEPESMRLLDPMTTQTDADEPARSTISVPSPRSRDHGSALCRFEVSSGGQYEIRASAFAPSGESNSFYVSIDRKPVRPDRRQPARRLGTGLQSTTARPSTPPPERKRPTSWLLAFIRSTCATARAERESTRSSLYARI